MSYTVVYMLARRRLHSNGVRESRHTEERTRIANDGFGAIREISVNALNTQTEQQVLDTLQALPGERTIILVTHRLSAVQRCDIVFEVAAGTIVRRGTYDELMRDSAHFRRSASSP